jgi:hypothetical protein
LFRSAHASQCIQRWGFSKSSGEGTIKIGWHNQSKCIESKGHNFETVFNKAVIHKTKQSFDKTEQSFDKTEQFEPKIDQRGAPEVSRQKSFCASEYESKHESEHGSFVHPGCQKRWKPGWQQGLRKQRFRESRQC